MSPSLGLAAQPRAGDRSKILTRGCRGKCFEDAQRLPVLSQREQCDGRIAIPVVMKDVERLCVFAFFEQLPAPQVGRIQFGRVDRVFDHTHAAQMAAEFYGPQRGIVLRTNTGIFGRIAAANLLLAPVGISDAADDAENLVAVREAVVTGDAGRQLRPQLARTAYRKQAVRTPKPKP